MRLAPVVLAALVAAGCSLDYEPEATTPADQVPQMVFTKLSQVGVKDGRSVYKVEAQGSEVFPNRKEMRLRGFHFEEYDQQGNAASTGEAEAGVINTSTNDATLSGTLKAHSTERGVDLTIAGGPEGTLTWNNDSRQLRTASGTAVSLQKADGSLVSAQGLVLDLDRNSIELENAVQGRWTTGTDR